MNTQQINTTTSRRQWVSGDSVVARVAQSMDHYALGADDPGAVNVDGVIYAVEGDYGIGWCAVKLSDARDHDAHPADYVHIPLDRLAPAA